jgi:hypothetical protein
VNRRFTLAIQIAGLAASGWFVWTQAVAAKLSYSGILTITAEAAYWVSVTWIASALIALVLFLVSDPDRGASAICSTATKAVWFAPAIILLSTFSVFGSAIGLVLVVTTSRTVVTQLIPKGANQKPRRWNPFPSVSAALALQFGWVALMWGYPFYAAILFALSCALIVAIALLRSGRKRERAQPLPPSPLGALLTLLLALGISIGGLEFREFTRGGGSDGGGGNGPMASTELTEPESEAAAGGGGFFGVILRVPRKTPETIFAPPPKSLLKAGERSKDPLIIRFSGEYWMYQVPFSRPPMRSVVRKGTPLELTFHTTNGHGMSMEATQRLPSPMDASCCSALNVEITREGNPGPLSMFVMLEDSAAHRTAFLGDAPVSSDPRQTLRYSFSNVRLQSFDRIRVQYHRGNLPLFASPRIAVERFILDPR